MQAKNYVPVGTEQYVFHPVDVIPGTGFITYGLRNTLRPDMEDVSPDKALDFFQHGDKSIKRFIRNITPEHAAFCIYQIAATSYIIDKLF